MTHSSGSVHESPHSRLPVLGLLVMLVLLCCSSAVSLVGDVVAHQAERIERQWESSSQLSVSQWRSAQGTLSLALKLSPYHPDYLLSIGRLSSWRFFVSDSSPEEAYEDALLGLAELREQVGLRPYWPYGWGELALLKAQLGEVDDEFFHAVEAALAVGPNEKQVIVNVVNALMGSWTQLSWEWKDKAMSLLQRGLTLSYVDTVLLGVADKHGMKPVACHIARSSDAGPAVLRQCK